ncbi:MULTISPECIES: hypothetical protein [unclassified Pseudomonas]|uniref:hypothetical protein n=1 Tax=unclassified Pseudomonas TaxID=196821 RepID=UPI000A1F04B4|nr:MULTISPECIES: hypothetical protein [unclassified Pseudomonas]
MARVFVVLLTFLLTASCTYNHGRPAAVLYYQNVEITPSGFAFLMRFTSDADLFSLVGPSIGEGLVCGLEDDLDFSIGHYLKRSGRGSVEFVNDSTGGHYESRIMFRESGEAQGEEAILSGEALRDILVKRPFIVCAFRAHASSYSTYFSNAMNVPTADLIRAIDGR